MAQDVQSATVLASLLGREATGEGQAVRINKAETDALIEQIAQLVAWSIDPKRVQVYLPGNRAVVRAAVEEFQRRLRETRRAGKNHRG